MGALGQVADQVLDHVEARGPASVPRERAIASALDKLHTEATVLAGDASKAAGTPGATALRDRRRVTPVRWRIATVLTALGALLGAGPALGAPSAWAQADTPATTAANGVTAHGGAADLGPTPGLTLASPVLGIAPTPSGNGYWLVAGDGGVFTYGDAPFIGSTGAMVLNDPVVGIAAKPSGDGYWLVARDGGVFAFGDAAFFGSTGDLALNAPMVGIAATPTGDGYWLVARDGGVFAFGDAAFLGSTAGLPLAEPVTGIAATPTGGGYWLAARDGGVFAFGDATFLGSASQPGTDDVAGIAAAPDRAGYWLVRESGVVHAFGVLYAGDAATVDRAAAGKPTVAIAARPGGGYWLAQGHRADLSGHPFLVCTRAHESDTSGGYRAISPGGTYRGAYQFLRSTWDNTARSAGRVDLVGVDPAAAEPADQDYLALSLYRWQGAAPWGGRCAGL